MAATYRVTYRITITALAEVAEPVPDLLVYFTREAQQSGITWGRGQTKRELGPIYCRVPGHEIKSETIEAVEVVPA